MMAESKFEASARLGIHMISRYSRRNCMKFMRRIFMPDEDSSRVRMFGGPGVSMRSWYFR